MRGYRRLAVLVSAMLAVSGPALAEGRFGVTSADGVSLRQRPSASSTALSSYPKETWMAVTGEDGGWVLVTAPDGLAGYLSRNQLTEPSAPVVNVGVVAGLDDRAYVNLRESPHYLAGVLGTYHNGVPCLLLSHSNGWYHVRMEGIDGYLREEFVETRMAAWAEETATVIVQGDLTVELREGPGEQYASLGECPGGTYVMVIQRGNGWWYVSVGGKTGYLEERCLREGVLTLAEIELASWVELSGAYAVVSNPSSNQLLNMREQPTTVGRIIAQYPSGTRVALLNQGLEWCRVRNSAGEIGYMMTQYLTLEGVPEVPTMTVTHPDESYVNLRSVPSTTLGAVLAQVPHGEQVAVLTPGNEWVKVRYNDMEGYMMAWFLK